MIRAMLAALLVLTVSVFVLLPPQPGHGWGDGPFHGPGSVGWLPTCTSTDQTGATITCPPGIAFRDWKYLQAHPNNPVITNPRNDGVVYINGNPYLGPQNLIGGTWYGFGQCNQHFDFSIAGYNQLCEWTSTDLVHWTDNPANPIIRASSGTWRAQYLLKPNLKPGCNLATYCLYFSAQDGTGADAIGLLLASNIMGPWTEYSGNPIIPATTTCAGASHFMLPGMIRIGSTDYMYLAYGDNTSQNLVLFTAPTTTDTTWTCVGVVFRGPVAGDWDANGTPAPNGNTPNAALVDVYGQIDPWVWKNKHGFYEMLYTTVYSSAAYVGYCCNSGGQATGYAVSADALTWFKYTPSPTHDNQATYQGSSSLAMSCPTPAQDALCPPYFGCNGTAGNNSVVPWNGKLYSTPICVSGGQLFTMPDY